MSLVRYEGGVRVRTFFILATLAMVSAPASTKAGCNESLQLAVKEATRLFLERLNTALQEGRLLRSELGWIKLPEEPFRDVRFGLAKPEYEEASELSREAAADWIQWGSHSRRFESLLRDLSRSFDPIWEKNISVFELKRAMAALQ